MGDKLKQISDAADAELKRIEAELEDDRIDPAMSKEQRAAHQTARSIWRRVKDMIDDG